MQYLYVDHKAAPDTCHLGAGSIQGDEQQHQAAARTAKQLTGVTIEESSIKTLHSSLALQAHTSKQETKNTASGLDLLKVCSAL